MFTANSIRNICLLGHSGSGKTALAESLLYMTGAIDRMGKNADGNTVCDYDPEEIRRNISISTSVIPVEYKNHKINILDTPGAFDFAGAAMEALRAADAAIIVCSAKDGISVGAERNWKLLKAANMPTIFCISKTGEENGNYAGVLSALQEKYGSIVCAVTAPMSDGTGVIDLVHNVAYQTKGNKTTKIAVPAADADMVESLRETLMEAAAGADEELMMKYLDGEELKKRILLSSALYRINTFWWRILLYHFKSFDELGHGGFIGKPVPKFLPTSRVLAEEKTVSEVNRRKLQCLKNIHAACRKNGTKSLQQTF